MYAHKHRFRGQLSRAGNSLTTVFLLSSPLTMPLKNDGCAHTVLFYVRTYTYIYIYVLCACARACIKYIYSFFRKFVQLLATGEHIVGITRFIRRFYINNPSREKEKRERETEETWERERKKPFYFSVYILVAPFSRINSCAFIYIYIVVVHTRVYCAVHTQAHAHLFGWFSVYLLYTL